MKSVKAAVEAALIESGVEDHDRIARRVTRRLAAHRGLVVDWLVDQDALRFVGYVSPTATPTRIRQIPMNRHDCHLYVAVDKGEGVC